MNTIEPSTGSAPASPNLRRARRHAIALERLALTILVASIVVSLFLVAGDLALLWPTVRTLAAAIVLWGAIRALALFLHLRTDELMDPRQDCWCELRHDPEATEPQRPPTVSGP